MPGQYCYKKKKGLNRLKKTVKHSPNAVWNPLRNQNQRIHVFGKIIMIN